MILRRYATSYIPEKRPFLAHGGRSIPQDMVTGSSDRRRRAPRPAPTRSNRSVSMTGLRTLASAHCCWASVEDALPCSSTASTEKSRTKTSKIVSSTSGSTCQFGLLEDQLRIDDQREQLSEHQPEVQVLLLLGVGAAVRSRVVKPSACSRNRSTLGSPANGSRPVAKRRT